MGFWASAAKKGANPEVWAAAEAQVRAHRAGEAAMMARARALGASHTIIRAGTPISEGGNRGSPISSFVHYHPSGTLKGGGNGGSLAATSEGKGDRRLVDRKPTNNRTKVV